MNFCKKKTEKILEMSLDISENFPATQEIEGCHFERH